MTAKKPSLWDVIEWHRSQERVEIDVRLKAFHHQAAEALLAYTRDSQKRTVKSVAAFVQPFDTRVDHPYCLSDIILLKFGVIRDSKAKINHAAHNARERAKNCRFKTLPGA